MADDFYLFLTLLTPRSTDTVTAALVKKGFAIAPLSSTGELEYYGNIENPPSSMLALKLNSTSPLEKKVPVKEGSKVDAAYVRDIVADVCKDKKVKYFSLLITGNVPCAWQSVNFSLDEAPKPSPFEESIKTDLIDAE